MAEYIERKALIQTIHKDPWIGAQGKDYALCDIAEQPTADVVEVRHGEWLPYPSDAYMKCSICGMEYHKSRMPDVVGYCPNPSCGAKMDGKGDNDG